MRLAPSDHIYAKREEHEIKAAKATTEKAIQLRFQRPRGSFTHPPTKEITHD